MIPDIVGHFWQVLFFVSNSMAYYRLLSGCNPKGNLNPCFPGTKNPLLCSMFKTAPHKAVLEQFLEFTDFPVNQRDDLINHFISSHEASE